MTEPTKLPVAQTESAKRIRCSAWLCRIGWHRWTKWEVRKCTTTSIFYQGEREALCETRECECCGKTQIVKINAA